MNPYPLVGLNHFTVPLAIVASDVDGPTIQFPVKRANGGKQGFPSAFILRLAVDFRRRSRADVTVTDVVADRPGGALGRRAETGAAAAHPG